MSNIVKITKAKKKSKNHIGFLGLLLFVSIICFFLLSPIFAIEEIEVSGNQEITANYIITSSGILYGENILRMNKIEAAERLKSVPLIEEAHIKRAWPNKIIIAVEEKAPVAEVAFYGSKLLISERGDVLRVITDKTETNLPVLEGITVKDVTVGAKLLCNEEELLKNYSEILKILKENDMLVDVVKISNKDGLLVTFNMGHAVFFGDTENLRYKVEWLKKIFEKEENPAYIDLHNLDRVVAKPVWGMFDNEVPKVVEVNASATDTE